MRGTASGACVRAALAAALAGWPGRAAPLDGPQIPDLPVPAAEDPIRQPQHHTQERGIATVELLPDPLAGLRLEAALGDARPFRPGEPIWLRVTLRNDSRGLTATVSPPARGDAVCTIGVWVSRLLVEPGRPPRWGPLVERYPAALRHDGFDLPRRGGVAVALPPGGVAEALVPANAAIVGSVDARSARSWIWGVGMQRPGAYALVLRYVDAQGWSHLAGGPGQERPIAIGARVSGAVRPVVSAPILIRIAAEAGDAAAGTLLDAIERDDEIWRQDRSDNIPALLAGRSEPALLAAGTDGAPASRAIARAWEYTRLREAFGDLLLRRDGRLQDDAEARALRDVIRRRYDAAEDPGFRQRFAALLAEIHLRMDVQPLAGLEPSAELDALLHSASKR